LRKTKLGPRKEYARKEYANLPRTFTSDPEQLFEKIVEKTPEKTREDCQANQNITGLSNIPTDPTVEVAG
jgi:hypothetical protein